MNLPHQEGCAKAAPQQDNGSIDFPTHETVFASTMILNLSATGIVNANGRWQQRPQTQNPMER